ncbi:hypothetical protein [Buttiauxella izardii]|uniref:Uncharacterized protein n=1 Tax=Buttiauxella izardii TaxID=82991 RepID=A0A3A5JQ59_9ENTR|nr:hypothetical protein [Buttiauxella izardii]RJT21020.1 hypothetical protein D6029_14760 [Buttiauxella izardii]
MNRTKRLLLIAIVSSLGCFSQAYAVTQDNVKYQQVCGKSIAITVSNLEGNDQGHTLIGLKNKSTMETDLFLSEKPTTELMPYEQYNKVYFDNLSGRYLPSEDSLSIVWGGAQENGKEILSFSLALGSHVYPCGKLEKLPDEMPDRLYGE